MGALTALLLVAGCSSANPSNRQAAEAPETAPQASPSSWPLGGGPPAPVVTSTPRPAGVSSDPGTRYLSMGSVGALTVETAPPPPPVVKP